MEVVDFFIMVLVSLADPVFWLAPIICFYLRNAWHVAFVGFGYSLLATLLTYTIFHSLPPDKVMLARFAAGLLLAFIGYWSGKFFRRRKEQAKQPVEKAETTDGQVKPCLQNDSAAPEEMQRSKVVLQTGKTENPRLGIVYDVEGIDNQYTESLAKTYRIIGVIAIISFCIFGLSYDLSYRRTLFETMARGFGVRWDSRELMAWIIAGGFFVGGWFCRFYIGSLIGFIFLGCVRMITGLFKRI